MSRLESLGYAVLEAKTGPEAITLLESGEPIALVFSDIIMPGGMTGYDVAEWVRSMKPELKVLLTSGYSDMPLAVSEAVRAIKVLGKPYTREQLACALREALDGCPLAEPTDGHEHCRLHEVPEVARPGNSLQCNESGSLSGVELTRVRSCRTGDVMTHIHRPMLRCGLTFAASGPRISACRAKLVCERHYAMAA